MILCYIIYSDDHRLTSKQALSEAPRNELTKALPAAEMSAQGFRKVGDRRGRAQVAAVIAELQRLRLSSYFNPFSLDFFRFYSFFAWFPIGFN